MLLMVGTSADSPSLLTNFDWLAITWLPPNLTTPPEDSRLAHLDRLDFDQLRLLAVDPGDGLSERDVAGILLFRMQGRGVLTARDHDDLGSSLRCLGALGVVNHFHTETPR